MPELKSNLIQPWAQLGLDKSGLGWTCPSCTLNGLWTTIVSYRCTTSYALGMVILPWYKNDFRLLYSKTSLSCCSQQKILLSIPVSHSPEAKDFVESKDGWQGAYWLSINPYFHYSYSFSFTLHMHCLFIEKFFSWKKYQI